jgi:hypothetical protein
LFQNVTHVSPLLIVRLWAAISGTPSPPRLSSLALARRITQAAPPDASHAIWRPARACSVTRHGTEQCSMAWPGVHSRSVLRFASGFFPTRPRGAGIARLTTDHAACSCLRLTVATNSPRRGLHLQSSAHAGHTSGRATPSLRHNTSVTFSSSLTLISHPDRRAPAIANALDGLARADAARLAGMSGQALCDAKRYNAESLDGLYDRPKPGRPRHGEFALLPGAEMFQDEARIMPEACFSIGPATSDESGASVHRASPTSASRSPTSSPPSSPAPTTPLRW